MASQSGAYNAGTAHVDIKPKIDGFARELKDKLKAVNVDHDVKINADTATFAARVRAALDSLPDDHSVTLGVNLDSKGVRQELETLSRDKRIALTVAADTSFARQEIDQLGQDRRAVLRLDADTSMASTKVGAATRDRAVKINANADTWQAETQLNRTARDRRSRYYVDTKAAESGIDKLTSKMRGLDRYQRHVAMNATGIAAIGIAAAAAIGPLSSMVGLLAKAAGSAALLPAMLGGGIAGIAGIGVGVSGIGAAFGSMGESAESGSASAARSARASEKAVASAQRGVERAQRGVTDAHRGVERAERGVVDAQRGIRDAERDLAQSQRDSQRAQENLNRARSDAVDNLEDMNDQLRASALDEEGAVLAVARAKQRLDETMRDSSASGLDRAEADLAHRRAIQSLEDIREKNTELAADVAEANRKGVEGSDEVVAAREQVEEAQWAEMKSAEGLEGAHHSLADAQQGVVDAHQGVADAQQAVLDAQDNLTDAIIDAGEGAEGAAGGVDRFAAAMANLAPSAQAFVRAIQALGPAWTDLRLAAQDALFHEMGNSITTLADRQLPVLKDGLVAINSELNGGLRSSMRAFSSESAATDFTTFLSNSATGLGILAQTARPLSYLWMDLATVGSEYLPAMSQGISDVINKWSRQVQAARETGELATFIDESIDALKTTLNVTGEAFGLAFGVGRASAQAAQPYMSAMSGSLQDIHKWVDSLAGQKALGDFFDDAMGTVSAVLPSLSAVGGIIAQSILPAIRELVEGVGPGAARFLERLGDNLGNHLAPAAGSLGEMLGDLLDTASPLIDVFGSYLGIMEAVWPVMGSFLNLLKPLTSAVGFFSDEIAVLATAFLGLRTYGKVFDVLSGPIGKLGGSFRDLGEYARMAWDDANRAMPNAGRHRKAFEAFGPSSDIARIGMDKMRGAGRKLVDAMGGPLNIALSGATTAIALVADAYQRSKQAQEDFTEATSDAARAQDELQEQLAGTTGALDEQGLATAARIARGEMAELIDIGGSLQGMFNIIEAPDLSFWQQGHWNAEFREYSDHLKTVEDGYDALERAARDAGYTVEDVPRIVAEGGRAYDDLYASLLEIETGGEAAANELASAKAEMDMAIESARQLDPNMIAVGDAVGILADKSSTADEKLGALRTIMQDLGLYPKDAEQAMRDAAEAVDEFAERAGQAADKTGMLGDELVKFNEDGSFDINFDEANGRALFDELKFFSDTLADVAAGGGDVQAAFDDMYPSLETTLGSFGLVGESAEKLLDHYSQIPSTLETYVNLEGIDETTEQIGTVATRLTGLEVGATVTVAEDSINDDTMERLDKMGVKVEDIEGTTNVALSLKDEEASEKLAWWIDEGMPSIELASPTAKANLDTTGLMLNKDAALAHLSMVDLARPNPLASMDISMLSQAQIDALNAVGLLDGQTPTPDAKMDISELDEEQKLAMAKVFNLNEETPTPWADMNPEAFDAVNAHLDEEMEKINNDSAEVEIKANTDGFTNPIKGAIELAKEFWEHVQKLFDWDGSKTNTSGSGAGGSASFYRGGIAGYAQGGHIEGGYKLPDVGPGTGRIDGFMGLDDDGMAIARVNAGEWVINRGSSRKYDKVLKAINMGVYEDTGENLEGFYGGGRVPGLRTGGLAIKSTAGPITTGIQASMNEFVGARHPSMMITDGTRFGNGNDHHFSGQAVDYSNGTWNTPQMTNLARDIYRNFKEQTAELIHYPHNGFHSIKEGQDRNFGSILNAQHRNHVHWAMRQPLGPARPDMSIPTSAISDLTLFGKLDPFSYEPTAFPQVEVHRPPRTNRPDPYTGPSAKALRGYNLGGMVELTKFYREQVVPTPGRLIPGPMQDFLNSGADRVMWGSPESVSVGHTGRTGEDHDHIGHDAADHDIDHSDPLHGLAGENLEGVGDSVDPLVAFRESDASNPDYYSTMGGASGGNSATSVGGDSLPTTWGGLATHLATPFIEGHVSDLLGVLGVSNQLPPAMRAVGMVEEQYQNNGQSIYRRPGTETSITPGASTGEGFAGYGSEEYEVSGAIPLNPGQIIQDGTAGIGANHTWDPSRGAEQWRPMVIAAHQRQGLPIGDALADAFVRQINTESTGNPRAVQQIWDDNGTGESAGVGLLQFIPTTFAAYRDTALVNDRKDAWANLNAGARYGDQKYGDSLLNVIGHGHGWKDGGDVWGAGGPKDDAIVGRLSNGEFVTNALSAEVARPLLHAMNDSPALAARMAQAFDGKMPAPSTTAGGTVEVHYHIETNELADGMRRAEMHSRRQVSALAGR